MDNSEFDVIVVGSGTCGSTIARELAKQNKKVLMLEQGADVPLRETLSGVLAILQENPVADKLKATSAVAVGGSTGLYFGICRLPTAETYDKFGIDLSAELEEVKKELPIAELPDAFLSPQSIAVRDSAAQLGYSMKKHLMTIDQSQCAPGEYADAARWKAKSFVDDAVGLGATLITRAKVEKIIIENGRAVGVEYKKKGRFGATLCKAYGKKIVLSGGAFSTPKMLVDCGVENVCDQGFFCHPAFMVFGTVAGLKAKNAFSGILDYVDLGNGVYLGDGVMSSFFFKLFMVANLRLTHIFSYSRTVSITILTHDDLGGTMTKEGRYHKQFTAAEFEKMKAAEEIAVKILQNAGAKHIFRSKMVAGIPGGALRIREHVDENLQTKFANLYVCDHSLMADKKVTPMVTLMCLAKRLAKHLAGSLQAPVDAVAPALASLNKQH